MSARTITERLIDAADIEPGDTIQHPARRWPRRTVDTVETTWSGTLWITFIDGARLHVAPSVAMLRYEVEQ